MRIERMRICAVVVTHSRPDLLVKVMQALQGQIRPVDRIIVVDNASDIPTQVLLGGMDNLSIVRSEINLGGAGGFALGMEEACALGADWIWLLDDDAIPQAGALAALAVALPNLPGKIGAVCGAVREYGDIATMHRRKFGNMLGRETCLSPQAYFSGSAPIDTGSFVGFMVSVSAIAAVGLPNPAFFLAYDDTEYSLRLKAAGYGIWLIPASVVEHMRGEGSRLRYSEFGRKHYFNIRNRIIVKRTYSYLCNLSAFTGVLFGFALWIRCKGRFRRKTFRVLLKAIFDGYQGRLGPYPHILEGL
jgi:rhamnopyranosyl-N-acetylglucosaminyl-diphospho-decaprenol beta-1,3/1,4-galactofuranosyltransferase